MANTISFDIWDTIIKRKCNPEEIKLKTAQYILLKYGNNLKKKYCDIYNILIERDNIESFIGSKSVSRGFDNEYKIEDVFDKLCSKIFLKKVNIIMELVNKELEFEKNSIYLNEDILPIFEKYKSFDMYCISDFYMGEKQLLFLLKYLKIDKKFKKIYSSCDYMYSKKSGRLFNIFADENDIDLKNHIHVGDNSFSDIEVPSKFGVQTIKMQRDVIPFSPTRNRKINISLVDYYKKEKNEYSELFNCGVELAPIVYSFIYNVIDYAIKNNYKTIYYQTREGETFIKFHNLIKNNNPFGINVPEGKIMEVSRMATFAPSLKEFSVGELLRLWSQYRCQSLNMLFRTLDIDLNDYKTFLKKYDLDENKLINEPWFNVEVQNLFNDKDFLYKINNELNNKKNELIKYFSNLGITNNGDKILVVDIGWRGTIQDNLAYIFDKNTIDGYYITLFDYYNYQPNNTIKHALIKDTYFKYKIVASVLTLLEWIYNPGTGSVINYSNGLPNRKIKSKEKRIVNNMIFPMQDGMLFGAEKINSYFKIHPYEASELEDYAVFAILRAKSCPSKSLVNSYYQMVFNDTFGTAEYIEKKQKLSFFDKINLLKCKRIMQGELWKEAFIIYNNLWYVKLAIILKNKIKFFLSLIKKVLKFNKSF